VLYHRLLPSLNEANGAMVIVLDAARVHRREFSGGTRTTAYPLIEAKRALEGLKHDRIQGSGVLVVTGS